MDIGGPLRGTWLTVLVISIAFAAAGVATAEPWSAPAGTALSAEGLPAAVPSSAGSPGTSVSPSGQRAPATIASAAGSAAAAPSHEVTTDEIALWERQENHGFYVSSRAKATGGTGNGCGVSDVARSDVGKPDTAKSDPAATKPTCDESRSGADEGKGSDNSGKGSDNSGKGSDNSGKGSDDGSSSDNGGGSDRGDGGDE